MVHSLNMVTLSLLIICIGIPAAYAIWCFDCNSHEAYEGSECWYLSQDSKNSTLYKDCSAFGDGKDYVKCRVMVQTVDKDVRIIRSCATKPTKPDHDQESRCIDRTGTDKVKLRYCACDYDGCNSAPSVLSSFIALSTAVVGALLVSH